MDNTPAINTIDVNLGYYIDRPTEVLPYDAVEAIGLDGSGVNADGRFPYNWACLTEDERTRLIAATGYTEDEDQDDQVVYWPVDQPTPAQRIALVRLVARFGLIALAWVLAAGFALVVLLTVPAAQSSQFAGELILTCMIAAAIATAFVRWTLR